MVKIFVQNRKMKGRTKKVSLYSGEKIAFDYVTEEANLFFCSIFGKRNPERTVDYFGGYFHFSENMTAVPFCTGRTSGNTDACIL